MNKNEVYIDDREDSLRLQEFIEILHEADKRRLKELISKRIERKTALDSQIGKCDKRVIKNKAARSNNIT
jgi:transposase